MSSGVLDNAYKHESNANVRERILLIRRIMSDCQDIRMVSKEEFHRSIAAYKWLRRRFDNDGLDGLKNKINLEAVDSRYSSREEAMKDKN
jgi:hypothetical protein